MLKIYFDSVIIYFAVFIAEGILFRKEYLKSIEKIGKEVRDSEEIKKMGYIRTTLSYFLISFIPIMRLIILIAKVLITFNPNETIKLLKEIEERDNAREK